MRTAGVAGRTVTLKVRFSDFTTITRSRTLRDATNLTPEIYATAADLFAGLGLQRARIRLVGVRVEGLVDAATAHAPAVLGARDHGLGGRREGRRPRHAPVRRGQAVLARDPPRSTRPDRR